MHYICHLLLTTRVRILLLYCIVCSAMPHDVSELGGEGERGAVPCVLTVRHKSLAMNVCCTQVTIHASDTFSGHENQKLLGYNHVGRMFRLQ